MPGGGDDEASTHRDPSVPTNSVTVTRTVKAKLETSQRKNDIVQQGIDAYQQVARNMAAILPSYPEEQWEPHNTHMYHHAQRFLPEDGVRYKTTLAQQAQKQVAESFKSWREKGKPGNSPEGEFGHGSYLGLRNDDIEVVKNERGWGVKTSFISYQPEWFHVVTGPYQRRYFERVTEGDATTGSAELHLQDDGTLMCHLTVSWDVEVYEPGGVDTYVGVDIGEEILYAAAVVGAEGQVETVEMEPAREFRHYRKRLQQKRAEYMQKDDLKAVTDARTNYKRYTEQVTDTAAKRVVDLTAEYSPCAIRIEDLTHYRQTAEEPIHDWPYDKIQSKIAYKATEAGIPVETINPRNTSITCRKCGTADPVNRPGSGSEFKCQQCDYEIHADVNAAINIATDTRSDVL